MKKEEKSIDYYVNWLKWCVDPYWHATIDDIKLYLGIHEEEPAGRKEKIKRMIMRKIGPIRRKEELKVINKRLVELIKDYNEKKEIADRSGKKYEVVAAKPGESLWHIANFVYRDGRKYRDIGEFEANGFGEERSIHKIIPGEAIFCPLD